MSKRALVIGIDDYQQWQPAPALSFPPLRYCRADAAAFATLLTGSLGFAPDDVTLLEDGAATLAAVLDGLTTLLTQSEPGDVACFYFAGYGGRVPEDGWGQPGARYYEAVVPYDGAGMVFDYQLAALAGALLPSGVNLTVVLDTAHSGIPASAVPGSRAFGWSEDLLAAFVAHCTTLRPLIALADPAALDGNISGPARANGGVTVTADPGKGFTGAARALLLSACDYGETAGESAALGHGYLTNALLGAAGTLGAGAAPDALLAALRTAVAGSPSGPQTPQLRGRPPGPQEMFLGPL